MKTTKKYAKKNLYGVLTAVLATLFFVAGFFTLGSFSHTGEEYRLLKGSSAVFELEYEEGQTYLKEIYVNFGAVYAEKDSGAQVTLKSSTSATSTASSTWTEIASFSVTQTGVNDEGLFNWSLVAMDLKKTVTVRRLNISADASVEINEIVCVANDGNPVALKVASAGNTDTEEGKKLMENAFDAQKSFTTKANAYYRFTQEEGVYLSYLRNLAMGSTYYGAEETYSFAEDFGSVAVLGLLPSVTVFGNSVFATRLPSLLATTLTCVFLALLFILLFKDGKYGFYVTCAFAVSGVALSAGRVGAPYAFVACALVGATYFAYNFFAKGISSRKVLQGGANVLLAGLLCALAVAMEGVALFPALGIVALLALGTIRQKKAHAYTLERLENTTDENVRKTLVRKENISYSQKTRALIGGASLGFIIGYFLLIFLSTILCHNAYARAYGTQFGFAMVLWKNICAGFKTSVVTNVASQGGAIALAWFLPLKSAVLYANGNVSWLAVANPILTALSFVSLVYCTVFVIKNRKSDDKTDKRACRVYGVLLGGVLLTVLSALVKGVNQTTGAIAFYAFYYGFILLAYYCLFERTKAVETDTEETEKGVENKDGESREVCAKKSCKLCKAGVWLTVLFSVTAFVLALPAVFGFGAPTWWAKLIDILTIL